MVPLFEEMIATLRGAEAALRQEMEQLSRAESNDAAAVQRLCEIGPTFQEPAHSLLVAMAYQDAPGSVIEGVEDLVGYFREALTSSVPWQIVLPKRL